MVKDLQTRLSALEQERAAWQNQRQELESKLATAWGTTCHDEKTRRFVNDRSLAELKSDRGVS